MPLSEFELIRQYFERQAIVRDDVVLGIGDDAALLRVPEGYELVVTVDTLIAGVHFPEHTASAAIGHKALAVNLSDLAAMGAEPAWFTLALTLPEGDAVWLEGFASGLHDLAMQAGVALVGGDTTRGPLSITIQAMGLVPQGQALRRDGAHAGDLIYVSGRLGAAGLALDGLQGRLTVTAGEQASLQPGLDRPQPRLVDGMKLRGLASSAIDISDGLLADLGHILERSGGLGASLRLADIPLAAVGAIAYETRLRAALYAGDDYELCFTVPVSRSENLAAVLPDARCIGVVEMEPGLRGITSAGERIALDVRGYDHFGAGS